MPSFVIVIKHVPFGIIVVVNINKMLYFWNALIYHNIQIRYCTFLPCQWRGQRNILVNGNEILVLKVVLFIIIVWILGNMFIISVFIVVISKQPVPVERRSFNNFAFKILIICWILLFFTMLYLLYIGNIACKYIRCKPVIAAMVIDMQAIFLLLVSQCQPKLSCNIACFLPIMLFIGIDRFCVNK